MEGDFTNTEATVVAPPVRGTGRKRGRPKGSGRGRAATKGSSPSPSPNPVNKSLLFLCTWQHGFFFFTFSVWFTWDTESGTPIFTVYMLVRFCFVLCNPYIWHKDYCFCYTCTCSPTHNILLIFRDIYSKFNLYNQAVVNRILILKLFKLIFKEMKGINYY